MPALGSHFESSKYHDIPAVRNWRTKMPQFEGYVSSLTADDRAEVIIMPAELGIPGAPEISKKVCHRATDGSTLRVEALNRAGAAVGDWVALSRKSGVLLKNAAVLLGIPLLGGMSGLAIGAALVHGFDVPSVSTFLVAAFGLLAGITIGTRHYRRLSADNQPVISRVLKTRTEVAAMLEDEQASEKDGAGNCGGCSGCLP
jgi:hypothetical protein